MGLTLAELSEIAGAELRGSPDCLIERIATLEQAGEGDISFLANPRYKQFLAGTGASAVILAEADAGDCPVDCLVSENPYLAHARIMTALYPTALAAPGVHPSAVVSPDAEIASTASVGANCYVAPGVVLHAGVQLGPGCVLLDDVEVGAQSRLVAAVTLCAGTRLGERCLVHPGAVIGGDGFGLANDDGVWEKVPQVGRAVLGNDVEVGSCTSIDRGAIGDTLIADGVKIDSQVHIAHNVQVGKHTAIAGCAAVAGSSHIGAYCTIAGGAGVTGHVDIADHVHVSGVTSVTRSLRKPGVYTGTVPAMDHATWLKNFARLRHLDDMVRRMKVLERELEQLKRAQGGDS